MAEPVQRSDEVQGFLDRLLGQDNPAMIRADICVLCGKPATQFTDDLSREEFRISGLCQGCQDIAFSDEDDDEDDEEAPC